jgi:hypothetical protein
MVGGILSEERGGDKNQDEAKQHPETNFHGEQPQ